MQPNWTNPFKINLISSIPSAVGTITIGVPRGERPGRDDAADAGQQRDGGRVGAVPPHQPRHAAAHGAPVVRGVGGHGVQPATPSQHGVPGDGSWAPPPCRGRTPRSPTAATSPCRSAAATTTMTTSQRSRRRRPWRLLLPLETTPWPPWCATFRFQSGDCARAWWRTLKAHVSMMSQRLRLYVHVISWILFKLQLIEKN